MSDCCSEKAPCCCSANSCITPYNKADKWITGETSTPKGNVPAVSTKLSFIDTLGAWKVRWGVGRMDYKINPGLYAVGNPDHASPVLVSANYKLSFDMLRKELSELDCWILVLDTKGINVWCAAGKGSFGTNELVNRVTIVGLSDIVTHKTLILPQLSASGVSAHEVTKKTGFTVTYGPVRASDIKAFINAGYKATKEMREVQFDLMDRLVLTPMELVPAIQKSLPVLGALFITNKFASRPLDKKDLAAYAGAVLAGSVVTPALLPYIPGKAFALKGWLVGLGWTVKYLSLSGRFKKGDLLLSTGELLLLPAVSSFLAMNFTGSSTYTSPSGVKKEMKKALPWIVGSAAVGSALTLGVHLFGRRKSK